MLLCRWLLAVLLCLCWTVAAHGGALVELTVDGTPYQGLSVIHNKEICWLAAKDGSYERLDLVQVSKFRKVGGEFRSLSASALASELRKDLGKGLEVTTRGDYVVCAPAGKAQAYADLVGGVQKSFSSYFNRRGWKLEQADFPLMIMVHPGRKEFDKACAATGMASSPLLKGFYHPQTNRVTLYDSDGEPAPPPPGGKTKTISVSKGGVGEGSRHTVVHEAIHQLAFNAGLHPRVGQNPRWVVEGLATMLEAGALQSTTRDDVDSRINKERCDWFRQYRAQRRKTTIVDLITRDEELFAAAPLDFYSEAWAFTFYLAESRRPDYVLYLKKIASRDPLAPTYPAAERLADFQAIFGKDPRWVETQFLRFIDGLE
jgi:hypothetical protein